jgi:hypothetical protein
MKSILRRLRGAVGNALLWAGAWFLAAFPVTAVLPFIIDVLPNFTYLGALTFLAPTLAVMGFVSGGAFSLYLGMAGRDHRINELNPGKVAFGTGVTVSLLMLVFLVLFVALRGFPVVMGPCTPGLGYHRGDRGCDRPRSGQDRAEEPIPRRRGSTRVGARCGAVSA